MYYVVSRLTERLAVICYLFEFFYDLQTETLQLLQYCRCQNALASPYEHRLF